MNFSAIVYIAVRIHAIFTLNILNLQRLKVDSFMVLAVLIFLKTYVFDVTTTTNKF